LHWTAYVELLLARDFSHRVGSTWVDARATELELRFAAEGVSVQLAIDELIARLSAAGINTNSGPWAAAFDSARGSRW
jgi:hypothetical protein